MPGDFRRCANIRDLKNRRQDIDGRYLRRDLLDGAEIHGRLDDERNEKRRVVEEQTVREFLVLSETLPVVARQNNCASIIQTLILEECREPAYLLVAIRHLPIVRTRLETRAERFRRPIGIVWIVQMNPNKERVGSGRLEPGDGFVHHLGSGTFKLV